MPEPGSAGRLRAEFAFLLRKSKDRRGNLLAVSEDRVGCGFYLTANVRAAILKSWTRHLSADGVFRVYEIM